MQGSFSRLDFQRNPASSKNAVKSFDTHLPSAAVDVYYRDVIGNISTSNLRVSGLAVCQVPLSNPNPDQQSDDAQVLIVRPRFPLFGGWKTQYTLGYNLPAYEVLSHDGSNFQLSIRFVDHIFDDMVIDHAEIRVILPEGASNIAVKAPFSLDSKSESVSEIFT